LARICSVRPRSLLARSVLSVALYNNPVFASSMVTALVVGVNSARQTTNANNANIPGNARAQQGLSANGQRESTSTYVLDGVYNNQNNQGLIAVSHAVTPTFPKSLVLRVFKKEYGAVPCEALKNLAHPDRASPGDLVVPLNRAQVILAVVGELEIDKVNIQAPSCAQLI